MRRHFLAIAAPLILAGATASAGDGTVMQRDHRTAIPIVRDHRSGAEVRDRRTPSPVVRDHRGGAEVQDHRGPNGAPQGGVTVTSSDRQRGSSRCVRSILGGPCIGLNWQWAR
jgi:hypothetical protein